MTDDPWDDLRAVWHQPPAGSDEAAVLAQVRRAERARRTARAVRVAIVFAGLGALGGAVAHAVTPVEAALALAIGVTIAASGVAVLAIERRQEEVLGAEAQTYLRARRTRLRTEWRLVRFVWAIVGLELAFLIPWWAGGIRVHFGGFASMTAVYAWWLPMSGIVGLGAWSVRRYRGLRREWRALGQAGDDASGVE